MSKLKTEMCIFCASPSDVRKERECLEKIEKDLNREGGTANHLGITVRILKYEFEVAPDAGAPQPVVFRQLEPEKWDAFVGILWLRFGTETGTIDQQTGMSYLSGTEEEFKKAYQINRHKATGWPKILLYRCTRPPDSLRYFDDPENNKQFERLKSFFQQCKPDGAHPMHVIDFETTDDFAAHVRNDIETYIWEFAKFHQLSGANNKNYQSAAEKQHQKTVEDKILNRYLREVWDDCLSLKLSTIDIKAATGAREAAELDLHAVYTDLDVEELQEVKAADDGKSDAGRIFEKTTGFVRINVMNALTKYPRLVILGDPGSGKSTLVNFLALCLAGEGINSLSANLNRLGVGWKLPFMLPLRIILRDYAARGLFANHSLWQFFQDELKSRKTCTGGDIGECIDAIHSRLERENGCLLLLDGLDEVPEAHRCRIQLKLMVEQFHKDFPCCRILVTSRPYAYQNAEAHLTGFQVRTLTVFSPEQVRAFIDQWYLCLGQKDHALGPVNARRYSEQLQIAINTNPRLTELATRPLLLTLMASLHRWREGGSLPEKRQELYEASINLLLDLWQRPKLLFDAEGHLTETQYDIWKELGISSADLRNALNEIAYEAHWHGPAKEGTHDIRVRDLVGLLYDKSDKGKTGTHKETGYNHIINYITERTGLLIEREQRSVYSFPHRTFQEYLAACHLADTDFPFLLYERLREDEERWREVTLLAAAKAVSGSKTSIWNLVNQFCAGEYQDNDSAVKEDFYSALRAVQALVETEQHKNIPERQKVSIARLKNWLAALVEKSPLPAQERAEAGRALAQIGDLRPGIGLTVENIPRIVWCEVPAGPFTMGTKKQDIPKLIKAFKGEKSWYEWETPQFSPQIQTFGISRYPVTQLQFRAFVNDGGYKKDAFWPEAKKAGLWKNGAIKRTYLYLKDNKLHTNEEIGEGPVIFGKFHEQDNLPVVGICWYEALAYCRWLTEKIRLQRIEIFNKIQNPSLHTLIEKRGCIVRLPCEPEWEKAARGYDERIFPWGNTFDPEKCNASPTGIGETSAAGIFSQGASPYGCSDMSGNVWEWCNTKWQENYQNYKSNRAKLESLNGAEARVLRGGACGDDPRFVRCAARNGLSPYLCNGGVGFRVVVSPFYDSDL